MGKWIKKFLYRKNGIKQWSARELNLSDKLVSKSAIKVLTELQKAGYEAYIVGGAVRDLILDKKPKDFDIATNAKPYEICQIFRRSRTIGRRFKIVHVYIGSDLFEVTTFRGSNDGIVQNEHGRIMQDNHYGSRKEDTARRDFTCNALYYDALNHCILDDHNGVNDIKQHRLVMIGKPHIRFQEDPVRILRAIRLSTKLGLDIEESIIQSIDTHIHLLKGEPSARLLEEINKIFLSGYSLACMEKCYELGINVKIHPLFSVFDFSQLGAEGQHFIQVALSQTDERVINDQPVSIGFIWAVLLWGHVERIWQESISQGVKESPAMTKAVAEALRLYGQNIPARFVGTMREIWYLQVRFNSRKGKRPMRLVTHIAFQLAYDFFLLRGQSGQVSSELVAWWQVFFQSSPEERQVILEQANHSDTTSRPKKRRRRRRPKVSSLEE